jgi:membrane protease YdiL (CAAX protease family)
VFGIMIISHCIAFFLIVAAPVWDHFETRRLKTSANPRAKVQSYWKTIGWLWIAAILAVAAVGWRNLFAIHPAAGEAGWVAREAGHSAFLEGMLAAFVVGSLLPAILSRWNDRVRATLNKGLDALAFFLPVTREERWWFALVCLTAGICEEILFRGFLIHYFRSLPFSLGLTTAVVLSCVVFGFEHLYQGALGVASTALVGFALAAVYLVTGNLLAPMILHALIDFRVLLILRPERE